MYQDRCFKKKGKEKWNQLSEPPCKQESGGTFMFLQLSICNLPAELSSVQIEFVSYNQ